MNNKDDNSQEKFEMDFICDDNNVNFPHSAFHYAQGIAWKMQENCENKGSDFLFLVESWHSNDISKLTDDQKAFIRYFAQSVVEKVMINLVKQRVINFGYIVESDDTDYDDSSNSSDNTNLN